MRRIAFTELALEWFYREVGMKLLSSMHQPILTPALSLKERGTCCGWRRRYGI